jgi:hypothetical protein
MTTCMLSKTLNFYQLYQHICGKSEVPKIYHFWCCVSILSAAMEDRFVCELYRGIPLKPNLYIGLIGPGSCGKGLAISQALQLLGSATDLNIYRGRATFAHIIDRLGKNTSGQNNNNIIPNPKMLLVMDELVNGVGANKVLIEDFISFMTEAYTAINYAIHDGNRKNGEVVIEKPCLNWLFGSTPIWLKKIMTSDIYESGFVARTQFVFARENLDCRMPRIFYPADYAAIYNHLQERLWLLSTMSEQLLLSPEAESVFDMWYYNRPVPDDSMLNSVWKRHKELVIRLAMINCVADFQGCEIQPKHINQAINMTNQLFHFSEMLLESANENLDTKPVNEVEKRIKHLRKIGHSDLLRYMRAKRGYTGQKLKNVINILRDEGKIKLKRNEKGGILYCWVKNY